MIWLTPQERKALWEEYPEVQEMYEEYNGILPEDDGAWERVAERCHQIREQYQTFCTKHQLSYYGCKECGKKTDLKDLKGAFINCECGGTARYLTNETAELIELNCINCGMPVALKYNAKKKLYETIRS